MNSKIKSVIWFVGGCVGAKILNDILYLAFNSPTTGVSPIRAAIPALISSLFGAYCVYMAFQSYKKKDMDVSERQVNTRIHTATNSRPKNIEQFEQLYYTSIFIGIYNATKIYNEQTIAFLLLIHFVTIVTLVLLIFFVARRRSKIAKWVLVVTFCIGSIFFLADFKRIWDSGGSGLMEIAQYIIQLVGIYYLFTPEVVQWLNGKEQKNNLYQNFVTNSSENFRASNLSEEIPVRASEVTETNLASKFYGNADVEASNNYLLCPQCATKLERSNGRNILCGTCGYKGLGIDVPSKFHAKNVGNVQSQIDSYLHKEKFKDNDLDSGAKLASIGNLKCSHCGNFFDGDKKDNPNCPYCAVPINEPGGMY